MSAWRELTAEERNTMGNWPFYYPHGEQQKAGLYLYKSSKGKGWMLHVCPGPKICSPTNGSTNVILQTFDEEEAKAKSLMFLP